MLEKWRNAVFFQWFRVSGQSKSRPVKAAGAESCGPRRKQKLHAAVAKSTFGSENVQNMTCSEHFCKFRCPKNARRCGEKHIFKWKCTKHVRSEALFALHPSQNCTPLWRKAHLKVKMLKNCSLRSTFWRSAVEKLPGAVAKRTFASQNVQNMTGLEHFCLFRCRKIARRCGERYIWKWKCSKTVVFGALLDVLMFHNSTPLCRKAVAKSTFGSENVQKL